MNISKRIDMMVEKRIIQINDEISKAQWYKDLQERLIVLSRQIPDEVKSVIEEYNSICEAINIHTADAIYLQAFSDGAEATKTLTPNLTPNP